MNEDIRMPPIYMDPIWVISGHDLAELADDLVSLGPFLAQYESSREIRLGHNHSDVFVAQSPLNYRDNLFQDFHGFIESPKLAVYLRKIIDRPQCVGMFLA